MHALALSFMVCGWRWQVVVAVKTTEKYHHTRIPVLQHTWVHSTLAPVYFCSDVVDYDIPTLDMGVGNTDQGTTSAGLSIDRCL